MKINKIYLKNLNALRGEHTIDFSQSPLRESDLVAIVGPTGAGKSTLLDAVLLSLYNKTPRFDKVSANELQDTGGLVTRGEKEAAAAIDFEVRKNGELKNYRAQWSASKGKKGEAKHRINSYSMTLSEIVADGGEILASGRASKVVPLVEKIIGLHYDQFVKAVMLSQGEFARLLKADKKERNQLLEKVTRSFDFREISKKAFEVHKEKKEALDERLRDLARYEILEEDEKKTIETRLANLAKASQEGNGQLEELRKSLELWESRRKLGGELDSIQAKQQLLEERKTAFQAKSLQLNRYDQALPFQADWKNLAERQKQLTGKKAEIKALLDKKALAEKRLEQLSENKAKAEQSLNEEAAKRQAYEGLWEAVKAQDLQISKKQVEAAEAEKQVQALEKKCAEREKELLEKKEEKEKVGQELVEAESWLKQHAVLENLQSDWGKLEALFSQLENYRDQFENECRQVSDFKAGEQIRLALEDNRLEDSLEDWKQKIKQKISEVEQARFFPDWGAEAYDPAIHLLEKSTVAEKEYEAVRKICDEQIQSQLDVQKKIEILLVELTAAETLERHALLSVEELQPKVERLKLENSSTVLGLRKELKEGVPCRVCGSIEHPFAEKPDESSLISQAEDELAKAKKQHTDRQQKLAELRQNKSAEEAKQQALTEGLARNQEQLKKRLTERDELRDGLEARGISGEAEEWKEKLATEMKSVRKIEKYPDLLQTFGRIGKALRSWKTSEKQWKALLEPYASYSEQLPELKNYSREFLDIKENAEKLKQRLAGAESLRENLQKSFLEETKSLQHAQGEFQLKRELLNSQKETRRTLFGDKSVEQVQKAYFEGVESLRKAVQEVKEQRASAEAEAKSVAGQCQDGKAAVQEQEEFVGSAKTELEEALREKGYASLSELESALGLSGADVLREERGALERETTELRTAREMKENEQKHIVEILNREERQEEEIRAAFSQQQDELTKIQEESAGEKAKLEISARNERQAKEISKQISRQEADLKVWATLNEMIGSATGDKFNDYAQSLMLGIMLEYANKHLNSISPRYRFVTRRGRGSTDELFVKDLEMGGEVRAVRTLSGGETFLLSLSLALGLSDMASQQVRIESLFIDEGFGTLDKDTLEDALCTLETLQNETNKKIMIISHVPELQERIGAQIRLKKVGGGYSKVEI